MKITIEIPDDCYGEYFDEDDNLIVQEPPVGDRAKREKLLDRSFDEWECFRSEMAGVVVDALLGMTPGYVHQLALTQGYGRYVVLQSLQSDHDTRT